MLEKLKSKLLVSFGVLLAPMAAIGAETDAASYEELQNAINNNDTPVNFTDNISFGEDGATLNINAATSIIGAAHSLTSNTNAQTPVFNVADGASLSITNLTIQQATNEGEAQPLLTGAGQIILQGVNLNNSDLSVALTGNGSLTVDGDQNTSIAGSVTSEGNNLFTKNGTGTLSLKSSVNAGNFTVNNGVLNISGTDANQAVVFANNNNIGGAKTELNGNTLFYGENAQYSASEINVVNKQNQLSSFKTTINGTEDNPVVLNIGNAAGDASSLLVSPAGKGEELGTATIGSFTNVNIYSNAELLLDSTYGNINIEAGEEAVTLNNESKLTISGKNTVNLGNKIETSEGSTAQVSVSGATVNVNADMSGANVYYVQNTGTVNVNDKFFSAAEGSKVSNGAAINFNNGASISTDNLTVENSSITFNDNDTAEITGAEFSKNGGSITYGENKISLSQADVTLNNGYILSNENADTETEMLEIGQDTQGVKTLTLQNASIGENANLNLENGVLNFQNNSSAAIGSSIAVNDESVINITNTNEIKIGSKISGNGVINKNQTGSVTMSGDSSSFSGVYNQTAGNVEFADDSKFYGGSSNISNSTLKLGKNVDVSSDAVLNLNGGAVITSDNNNVISASSVNVLNDSNKISGLGVVINGIAPVEEGGEAKYTAINIGDETGNKSSLILSPTSKEEQLFDEEGNQILDEDGQPVYKTISGNVELGSYTKTTIYEGSNLNLDTSNGNITISKNAAGEEAIVNNGIINISGVNSVTASGSIIGNGTINKAGSGNFTLNNTSVNAAAVNMTEGSLNLNSAQIDAATNSLVLNSINALNENNKISGHNVNINGLSEENNLTLTVGNDDSLVSSLVIAPTSVQKQIFDEEGNPVLDEDGNPTYTTELGNVAIGQYSLLNVKEGASLEFNSDNGNITVSANSNDEATEIMNNGITNVTGTNTVTINGSIIGNGSLVKSGSGDFNINANPSDVIIMQNKFELSEGNVNLAGDMENDNDVNIIAETVNVTGGKLNLKGNTSISALGNGTISADEINAVEDSNSITAHNLVINGSAATETTEARYTNITVGDSTAETLLTIAPLVKKEQILDEEGNPVLDEDGNPTYNITKGTAVVGKYTNIKVLSNGLLDLDSKDGNIKIEAGDNAISLANNSSIGLSGQNEITLDNSITTVEEGIANVIVAEDPAESNPTVNLNADMSGANVVYKQNAGIVNVNNKFFAAQEGSVISGNSTVNFNEGASISTNNLKINGANAAFNKNSISSITGANFAGNGGSITYGENTIALSQANVIINDGYVLSAANADAESQKIEIGQGTQGVKTLTLQNAGIGEGANLNLTNGTLTLQDLSSAAKGSNISLDADSILAFENKNNVLYVGSDISGQGSISKYDAEEEKTNVGLVQLAGNNSLFTGKYVQNAGIVEFLSGSTFFGDGTVTDITGGKLIINDGVNFVNEAATIIPVKDTTFISDTKGAVADLSTKQVAFGENQAVKFELQNSDLTVNKNVGVTASTNSATIGNDGTNTLVKNVSLGNVPYNSGDAVTVKLSGNNVLNLVNVNAEDNVGTLTVGNNILLDSDKDNPALLTTNFGDNTAMIFNIADGTPLNNKALNLELKAAQASDVNNNAKVVKAGNGTLLLAGNNSEFNGTLQVNNGSVSAVNNNALLGSNVKYSLQNVEKNAKISLTPVHNVTVNPDMSIIGINLADNASADLNNTSAYNSTVSVTGDTVVDNNSELVISAADTINLSNTKIGANSSNGKINLTARNINFNNVNPVLVNGESSELTLNGNSNVVNDFTLKNAVLNLNGNMFIGGNYSAGSTVNMINNQINTQTVAGNMVLTGNTNYAIDVDGRTLESDKVVVGGVITAAQPEGLNISQINLMSEPIYEQADFQVFSDANTALGQNIDPNVIFTASTGIIDAPVGRYVMNSAGNGKYTMSRVGFNPYVLAGSVAAQVGYYTQLNSYNMAFANSDMIMALPKKEREAYKNANKYAAVDNEVSGEETAADIDVNNKVVFEPSNLIENQAGGWFRPYGTFEKVKLKNGPEVGNNMYGAYVGSESMVKELGKGFDGTFGFYAGYDGSHQTYDGVGIYQNGGTIGLTGSLYKNDFFNLTTANIGASGADQKSNYGSADFWILRAGIANKTGYNWDLADGKFIIQPHLLMSLSSVNLFSYEGAPNLKMDGDSLFTWQIAPGFKFIGNTANGWQPYASVDMLWNVGGRANTKVNGIGLPEMYSQPWIEYGLGMQKRWGERFTGYGQAMFRGIGRNGVALSAGLRWKVGEGR